MYRRFDRPAVRIRHAHALLDEAPDEIVEAPAAAPVAEEAVQARPAAAEVAIPQPVQEEQAEGGGEAAPPEQAEHGAPPQPAPAAPAEGQRL